MPAILEYLWLVIGGLFVGMLGTLVGAGGGFVVAPVLMLLYPHDEPETITSISLAVTFANATSGSAAYALMKRINYRYGLLFAAACIPGAVLGALSTHYMPRRAFDLVFAVLLLGAAAWVFVKAPAERAAAATSALALSPRQVIAGMLISVAVGFLSSFLGIGGGIIHVPVLVDILHFPVHIATATSHFILAIAAGTGTAVHVLQGNFHDGLRRTVALAIGVLAGAQVGARLSTHVKGRMIIRALAVGLAFVAARLLYMVFVKR